MAQTTFISHSMEAEKSKIKMLANLVPGEDSLPGLEIATSSLYPHIADRGGERQGEGDGGGWGKERERERALWCFNLQRH